MTCASCASRVEKILSRQDGVTNAAVNLASNQARLLSTREATTEAMIAAVGKAGYTLTVRQNDQPKDIVAMHEKERRAALRRFVVAASLAGPTIVLAMSGIEGDWSRWTQAALATPVVFWAAAPFHSAAWTRLKALTTNMDTLISLGSLTAWAYSVWALSVGGEVFFETSAAIVAFILLGKFFESMAKGRASQAIARLIDLGATEARAWRGDRWQVVQVAEIKIGESIEVLPGAKIPVDGAVTEGTTTIDESMVTGEATPVDRGPGGNVIGGTVNHYGRIVVEATAVGDRTVLAGIVRLVEEAQATKAPIQRLADRVGAVFVPAVLVIAAFTLVGWLMTTGDLENSIRAGVSVLIIACPCALGLATPTAILVGTGKGAQLGVIYRSADVFERLETLDLVAFDKTGTLTTGQMTLSSVQTEDDRFLQLVASVEAASGHPIGMAVADGARLQGIEISVADGATIVPGMGVVGSIDDVEVTVGSLDLMAERALSTDPRWATAIETAQLSGATAFAGGWDGAVRGVVTVSDKIRPSAQAAISSLHRRGIETVMLTGDHEEPAKTVATAIGIQKTRARLLPGGKADYLSSLQDAGATVGFVGDGVNDAPALTTADLGMSVGTGSEITVEAGDVTLMTGDPRLVVTAVDLAARTLKAIRQNLWWAFIYNVAAIPLAVLGFLNPMIASAAMALSSVSVVANSLRIRRFKPAD